MDHTGKFASDLLDKLADLERKVVEHRQELAVEFHRYADQLLRDAPHGVRMQVEQVLKDAIHRYPVLSPSLDAEHPFTASSSTTTTLSQAIDGQGDRRRRGRASPPPVLPHTSGTPPQAAASATTGDGSRSPHAREDEFQGLFTPTFLPLLDKAGGHSRGTVTSPTSPRPASSIPEANSAGVEGVASPSSSKAVPKRPEPIRTYTGETVSSTASDDSATKARRSALRRSSSSSTKTGSPRRVRFDVDGQEVLTDVSPIMSPRITEYPPSPLGNPDNLVADDSPLGAADASSSNNIIEDVDEVGLLGNSPPRPKKISSTERIRQLAKNSNEDTSTWSVVGGSQDNDDDDDFLAMAPTKRGSISNGSSPSPRSTAQRSVMRDPRGDDSQQIPTKDLKELEAEAQKLAISAEKQQPKADKGDGNDGVRVPIFYPANGKKRPEPDTPSPSKQSVKSTDSDLKEQTLSKDEDLFHFDVDESMPQGSKAKAKYIEKDDHEDDHEQEPAKSLKSKKPQGLGLLSSSATAAAKPITQASATQSQVPPTPTRVSASMGSYKGKAFTMDVVKNKELHEQASKMGDLASFVGSVDGRSGVDESTSYRPITSSSSSRNPTGAAGAPSGPKSLSERMIMEEQAAAEREAADDEDGDGPAE